MAAVEKTYSFRAPATLADRMREARHALVEITRDEEQEQLIARELVRQILRDSEHLAALEDNQSSFMRAVLEIVVTVTEKVMGDMKHAAEFAAAARDRSPEDLEFTRAAALATAARWRNE